MSISKFQDRVTKSGCVQVVLFASAAVLIVGMFYGACAGGAQSNRTDFANGAPAFKLAGETVGLGETQMAIESALQRQRQQGAMEPFAELAAISDTLGQLVERASASVLAKKIKLPLDDNSIISGMEALQKETIPEVRANLTKQGQLKPGATDKEFEAKFKELAGRNLSDALKSEVDELRKNLADPKTRNLVVGDVTPRLLLKFYKDSMKITDADVKDSYDEWTLKRVYLGKADVDGPKALADLKNGSTFEGVMTKYSKDNVQGGKSIADTTIPLPKSTVLSSKDYEGLRTLKVGGITDVVKVSDGYAIYKLIGARSNAPKDFETNKASYVTEFKNKQANTKLMEEIKAIKTAGPFTWDSKGFQAAYEYNEALRDPALAIDAKAQEAKLRSIYAMAKAAAAKAGVDHKAAQLTQLQTVSILYSLKTADHAALLPAKIEAMEAVLEGTASINLELELSDLYVEAKNGPKAADALVKAMQSNGLFDATGQRAFGDIAAKATALKQKGMLSAADEKALTEEQNRWREGKAAEDKAAAEAKKIDEEAKKKADEEAKKAKASTASSGTPPAADKSKDPAKDPAKK